jgi:AraC family transcriptional regulator
MGLVHSLRTLAQQRHSWPNAARLSREQLRSVIRYARDRLSEPLGLRELARVARASPYHFAREFKAATGETPHRYVLRLRIARARELMRTHAHQLTLAAVAQTVGFCDQSHLARHFRAFVGLTPREWLRQQR